MYGKELITLFPNDVCSYLSAFDIDTAPEVWSWCTINQLDG